MSKTFKFTGFVLAMLAIVIFAGIVVAAETMNHEHMKMDSKSDSKTITVTGEVIDTACYTEHGAKGKDHAACAETCISTGQPAGILDAKGNVYIVLGEHHKSPAKVVEGFIADQVKATGQLIDKGGTKFLVVSKIEKAGEDMDKKMDMKSEKMEKKEDKD